MSGARPARPGAAFTDVVVGQETWAPADGVPAGPAGFAALAESLRPCEGAALTDLRWSLGSGAPGDRAEATVTRWRVEPGGAGRVHQDLRRPAGDGGVAERALAVWRVPQAKDAAVGPARIARDFGSLEWGRAIGELLGSDAEFAAATATFDGSLALAVGEEEVDFRLYRGAVVEVARKSLQGATFTIAASELTWVRLFTGPHDDYVRFAATGAFRVRGSGFQYLRMTKAVRILVDRVRSAVADGDHA